LSTRVSSLIKGFQSRIYQISLVDPYRQNDLTPPIKARA
jgi:hypothetical protein